MRVKVRVGLWRSAFGVQLYTLCGWLETSRSTEAKLHSEQFPLWLECDRKERCALVINESGEALALSELRDVQRVNDERLGFEDEGICKVTPLALVVKAYIEARQRIRHRPSLYSFSN